MKSNRERQRHIPRRILQHKLSGSVGSGSGLPVPSNVSIGRVYRHVLACRVRFKPNVTHNVPHSSLIHATTEPRPAAGHGIFHRGAVSDRAAERRRCGAQKPILETIQVVVRKGLLIWSLDLVRAVASLSV